MSTLEQQLAHLISNSANAFPPGYHAQLDEAIGSGNLSLIADLAEELVQEVGARKLWALVAYLMWRCNKDHQGVVPQRVAAPAPPRLRKKQRPKPSLAQLQELANFLGLGIDLSSLSQEERLAKAVVAYRKSLAPQR